MVRELFRSTETNHAGDSFERVKTTKEIVEHRAIDGGGVYFVFKSHQRATDREQVFVTLGVVIVEKLIEEFTAIVGIWRVHQFAFSSEPTTSASCRGSK